MTTWRLSVAYEIIVSSRHLLARHGGDQAASARIACGRSAPINQPINSENRDDSQALPVSRSIR